MEYKEKCILKKNLQNKTFVTTIVFMEIDHLAAITFYYIVKNILEYDCYKSQRG